MIEIDKSIKNNAIKFMLYSPDFEILTDHDMVIRLKYLQICDEYDNTTLVSPSLGFKNDDNLITCN